MDEVLATKLFAALVSYVVDHDSFVTKTKLLKLLYIFDVEYFRAHRRTFTQFEWKFFHLGPWCSEYTDTLDAVISAGAIARKTSENNAQFFYPITRIETSVAFSNLRDEMLFRSVLQRWATETTAKILDFVYFKTEPMLSAVRNQPLDFDTIPTEQPMRYSKTKSPLSPEVIRKKRAAFEAKIATKKTSPIVQLTPARYDDEFYQAMEILDAQD